MKHQRGILAKFIKAHPGAELRVVQYIGFARVYAVEPDGMMALNALAEYGRDRDAWRRLRELGYTREGQAWRKVPQAEQPVKAIEPACEHD